MSYLDFDFPHTRFFESDLRELIKQVFIMNDLVTNFVSINAIKYANPIQWDITKSYEKNTVVIDGNSGVAYISVRPVPPGVGLTREQYWTKVFDLSLFIIKAGANFANTFESEPTTTATLNTANGNWLVWDSYLYQALTDIHPGDRYVPDGNIRRATVEDFYNVLKSIIDNEIHEREAGDDALEVALNEETELRIEGDNSLHTEIVQESLNRENADVTLQDNINALSTALANANTNIQNNTAAIANNTNAIASNTALINNIIAQSSLAGESNFLIVSKKGGRFTNINDAIEYAKTYCSEQNRVCIVIMPGIYTETITLFPNTGIDLLGVGDVTIQAEAIYPSSPLYVGGNITVENIKFLAFNSSQPSYGLHIEAAAENCILKFTNCQFTSVQTSGAGIGMHNAMEVTFTNCKFISWSTNSVYAHNFPGPATAMGQKLRFFGCEFQSLDSNAPDAVIEDATYRMGYGGITSRMDVSFAHSVFNKGQIQYVEVNDGVITTNQPFLPALGNVRLDVNSIATLYSVDYYKYTPHIKITSYTDAIGLTVIPFNNADKYAWHVDEVKNQSGVVVTGDASIFATDSGGISIHTPNNVSQNNVYTISAVPKI